MCTTNEAGHIVTQEALIFLLAEPYVCSCHLIAILSSLTQTAAAFKWIPIEKQEIAKINVEKLEVQNYGFGGTIPYSAKEILIYVKLAVGISRPANVSEDIKIFTTDGTFEYAKYIALHTYEQEAWNTNSI